VVVLTIALSIGVSVSSRLLSTASRTTRSDTAARAYAAADAGLERFLLLSSAELDEVALSGDCSALGLELVDDTCKVVLNDGLGTNGDDIGVTAFVKVERYSYTDVDAKAYEFNLPANDVREVSLAGYRSDIGAARVTVCWDSMANDSYLFYSTYDDSGFWEKDGVVSDETAHDVDEFETGDGCEPDGTISYGKNISLGAERTGLRIKSLYGVSRVSVFPRDGLELPYQGHKIISVGKLEMPGEAEVAKKVSVYRPLPYLPGIFDFAIYSEGDLN
jgi:hypothetical protein